VNRKGSKGSLDKIEKEEIHHMQSPDNIKMCESMVTWRSRIV